MTSALGSCLSRSARLYCALLGPQYRSAWMLLLALVPALIVSCVTQVYYGLCRARGELTEATGLLYSRNHCDRTGCPSSSATGPWWCLHTVARTRNRRGTRSRLEVVYSLTRPGTTFFPAPARIHGPMDGGGAQ